mmetsp:Transcript_122945/g.358841  ORF Transcript_122945/g.358841 Transcript_122945/m.358841 type:complete len:202 (-) Transcript_122945:292-897(-)
MPPSSPPSSAMPASEAPSAGPSSSPCRGRGCRCLAPCRRLWPSCSAPSCGRSSSSPSVPASLRPRPGLRSCSGAGDGVLASSSPASAGSSSSLPSLCSMRLTASLRRSSSALSSSWPRVAADSRSSNSRSRRSISSTRSAWLVPLSRRRRASSSSRISASSFCCELAWASNFFFSLASFSFNRLSVVLELPKRDNLEAWRK